MLGPWQQMRQHLLGPIAFVLVRLGLSAGMLSSISVIFGLGFFLLAPFQFAVAFWLLVASIVCDGLDGIEARLTKTNTVRGAFTDMFCDQVVVAFSVAGLAWKGLIHPVLAISLCLRLHRPGHFPDAASDAARLFCGSGSP